MSYDGRHGPLLSLTQVSQRRKIMPPSRETVDATFSNHHSTTILLF